MKTIIIAEIGVNHNGSLTLAKELVDAAIECGADYVKFQKFDPDTLAIRGSALAPYQLANSTVKSSQHDLLSTLKFDEDMHLEMFSYTQARGIGFLSSVFSESDVDFITSLPLDFMKIPSGEITNLLLLRKIGRSGRKILLSTGMSNLGDIQAALDVLTGDDFERNGITLLHCNSAYPTPAEDANVRAIQALRTAFNTDVGYSDHTLGPYSAFAAVTLGASVIEKHLTLDRSLPGPDHAASSEPDAFREMVDGVRVIEMSLGNGSKTITQSEAVNRDIVRKAIVAKCHIKKGERFSEDNIIAKRPAQGISPMKWDYVLGKVAQRNYSPDDPIDKI